MVYKKPRISYKTPKVKKEPANKFSPEEREKLFLDYMSLGRDRRSTTTLHQFLKHRALGTAERVPSHPYLEKLCTAEKWKDRAKEMDESIDGAYGAWVRRHQLLPIKVPVPAMREKIRAKLYALADRVIDNVAYRQDQESRNREEAMRDYHDLQSATVALKFADMMEAGVLSPDAGNDQPRSTDVLMQVDSMMHEIERRAYEAIMAQSKLKDFASEVLEGELVDVTESLPNA